MEDGSLKLGYSHGQFLVSLLYKGTHSIHEGTTLMTSSNPNHFLTF